MVVNDIPLLTTLPAAAAFHLVIGVQADAELRVQRLVGRGLSAADAGPGWPPSSAMTNGGRSATLCWSITADRTT